mmetsp:Transcript_4668/g.13988  ORF Transcript_4668/g.13988 Transcript_4668/m.13988 type:complete len:122 (-) Transcript_4668:109-474(-)
MLYGPFRAMRPYSLPDAHLKVLLASADGDLATLALVDCAWDPAGASVAVVSDRLFVHVSKVQRRLLLKVPLRDVAEECRGRPAVSLQQACRLWVVGQPVLRAADARMRQAVAQLLHAALSA